MTTPIIGVAGWAGSGKDTFADILADAYNFRKIAFADPLREMAMAIDPIVSHEMLSQQGVAPEVSAIRYSDALARCGYNEAKFTYPEVRFFLQRLGTDAVRNVLGDNLWTSIAIERAWTLIDDVDDPSILGVSIADTRFKNEALTIKEEDGIVIKVVRPGVGPASDHISEHDLDGWDFDFVIENDGGIEDLVAKADEIIHGIWGYDPDRNSPWHSTK